MHYVSPPRARGFNSFIPRCDIWAPDMAMLLPQMLLPRPNTCESPVTVDYTAISDFILR
jgi:hypothetical protein